MIARKRPIVAMARGGVHAAGRLTVPFLQLVTLSVISRFLGVAEVSRYSVHLAALAVLFSIFELSMPNVYIADTERPSPRRAVIARLGTLAVPTTAAAAWAFSNPTSTILVLGLAGYRVSVSVLSLAQATTLNRGEVTKSSFIYFAHGTCCLIAVITAGVIATSADQIVAALACTSLILTTGLTIRLLAQPVESGAGYLAPFLKKGAVVGAAASTSVIALQIPIFYAAASRDDLLVAQMALIVNGYSIFLAVSTSVQQFAIYAFSRSRDANRSPMGILAQLPTFFVACGVAILLLWLILPIMIGVEVPRASSLPAVVACGLLPLVALISSKNLADQLFGHQLAVVLAAVTASGAVALLFWYSKAIFVGACIILAGTATRYVVALALDRLRGGRVVLSDSENGESH